MKAAMENLEQAAVAQQCRALRLPAVADQCALAGRRGRQAAADLPALPGSAAGRGVGRTRTQHHRAADQGCSSATHEDAR